MFSLGLLVCIALASLVSVVELAGRFRSFPVRAMLSLPGLLYAGLNVAAAVTVYFIAGWLTWDLGWTGDPAFAAVARGAVSGVAGMALLRSSLFSIQQGDKTVDVGLAPLLVGLREVIDRNLSQRHSTILLTTDLLTGLRFDAHHEPLTLLAQASAVDPDPADATSLGDFAANLKSQDAMADAVKLKAYSMRLVEVFGTRTVGEAADFLRREVGASVVGGGMEAASGLDENGVAVAQSELPVSGLPELVRAQVAAIDELLGLHASLGPALPEAASYDLDMDLRLRRAFLIGATDWRLAAWAYSEVPLDEVRLLLGAETVLDPSLRRVGPRLIPLLGRERPARRSALPRRKSLPDAPTVARRPDWLIATALLEMAIRVQSPPLAIRLLDVSIGLAPDWDALVARAAARLAAGDAMGAGKDLNLAQRRRETTDPPVLEPESLVVWRPVIDPLAVLLADDTSLTSEARAALWNSTVDGLSRLERPNRWTGREPHVLERMQGTRTSTRNIQPLDALNEVVSRVPPRHPRRPLRLADLLSIGPCINEPSVIDKATLDELADAVQQTPVGRVQAPQRPSETRRA